ncbi:MAG: DUF2298 domain-containing protein [Dehalococcoidia bacterium]
MAKQLTRRAGVWARAHQASTWLLALALIVVLGAGLRFHGLDWDEPTGSSIPAQMHPDERFISIVNERIEWPGSIAEYFDSSRSSLNPYNRPETPSFVYGTFPIFLTKAVATAAESGPPVVSHAGRLLCAADGYDTTVVCGRRLAALADTFTVLVAAALGTVLFGRRTGLLSGLLYALSVLPAQLSHFWTVDPFVVLFMATTALLCVHWIGGPGRRELQRLAGFRDVALVVAIGVAVGLGLASKVTAWPIVLLPVLAAAARVGLRDMPSLGLRYRGRRPRLTGHWSYDIAWLCLALLLAGVTFRIAQPYAFAGPSFFDMAINPQWRADIEREIDFQNGNVDFPPFVQFAGRTAFLWPLQNLVLWGLGPALGVAGLTATAVASVVMFRRRELAMLLPIAVVAAVLAFQGPRFVAYMRYFVPAYPFLCLFAAWGLRALPGFASDCCEPLNRLLAQARLPLRIGPRTMIRTATMVSILAVLSTVWWSLSFQSIFIGEHPRLAASRWIQENLPPGTPITSEIWDDSLPYPIPGSAGSIFPIVTTFPFDTDSPEKVHTLIYGRTEGDPTAGLNGADYVVIASDRARAAVQRMEREYPATIRYYELLDSGALGFELVAHFESRPSLFGIEIDDSGAEESFTVYDHPEVRIYRKTSAWDPERAKELLLEAHPERAVNLLPRQGETNGLSFTADAFATQQEGGTFKDLFDADGFTSHVPWVWWLIWMQVLAAAVLPWTTWLFRALPDRGYGVSKLIGFAASGLLTWLLVAWGAAQFTNWLIWGVALGITGAGATGAVLRRESLLSDARARWPHWLAAEATFLVAFFVVLAMRYNLPDLWYNYQGGEKPVELAFLTAIARSTEMPPYDPWFSGGTMNYYYMGWFLAVVPMRALRLLPEVGFNLALPTYAGLAAATAYSAGAGLASLSRRPRFTPSSAVPAGLLAAFLLLAIGNLDAAHQAIERFQSLNVAAGSQEGQAVYHWGLFSDVPFLGGAVGLLSGIYRWVFADGALPPFDWWRPSRVHYPAFDITEFPYFSFLFGDLHAHLMGLPFFGLTLVLGITYIASIPGSRGRGWALAAVMGVCLGLVRTVHTWDFPTTVLLTGAALAAGQLLRRGPWQQRWWDFAGHASLAGAVTLLLFAPYTQHNEVFETGIVRARETTAANQYFAHFGLFVAITMAFLVVRYREEMSARRVPGRNIAFALVAGPWEVFALTTFVVGLSAFTWRWGLATVALSLLALLFLANLLWVEYRRPQRDTGRLLATVLFAAGIGIAGGVDVVQVKYDIVRMNTVFKFSLQAWQVYAVASAYGLWYLAQPRRLLSPPAGGRRPALRWVPASLAVTALVVLLSGSLLYPWSGTRARMQARFPGSPSGTLDGLAYLPYGFFGENGGNEDPADDQVVVLADDAPIIRWLRDNVEGSPVIAEAVGPLYHWTSRISWNTGLPTVVGWDWHEVAYRTGYEHLVQRRRIETARFYTDPDPGFARDYLRRYDVSYIIVGTQEYIFGTDEGILKLAAMPELTEVFRTGKYLIYAVEKDRLGLAQAAAR